MICDAFPGASRRGGEGKVKCILVRKQIVVYQFKSHCIVGLFFVRYYFCVKPEVCLLITKVTYKQILVDSLDAFLQLSKFPPPTPSPTPHCMGSYPLLIHSYVSGIFHARKACPIETHPVWKYCFFPFPGQALLFISRVWRHELLLKSNWLAVGTVACDDQVVRSRVE